jgi:2-deoxy-D-gluconate 3-dehydrogenase
MTTGNGALCDLTGRVAVLVLPLDVTDRAALPTAVAAAAIRSSTMNDEIIARTPAKRFGKPDELIGATVFLSSRASDFVTGVNLPVDGGYSVY